MPNFRDLTAFEIMAQMPEARGLLNKHFGSEGTGTGSAARLRDLARWKGVDMAEVSRDLNAMARGTGMLP